MLLGGGFDELHAESQVLGTLGMILDVLLHCESLQNVAVVDSYRVDCILVGQDDAALSSIESGSRHIIHIHAVCSVEVLE